MQRSGGVVARSGSARLLDLAITPNDCYTIGCPPSVPQISDVLAEGRAGPHTPRKAQAPPGPVAGDPPRAGASPPVYSKLMGGCQGGWGARGVEPAAGGRPHSTGYIAASSSGGTDPAMGKARAERKHCPAPRKRTTPTSHSNGHRPLQGESGSPGSHGGSLGRLRECTRVGTYSKQVPSLRATVDLLDPIKAAISQIVYPRLYNSRHSLGTTSQW